MERHIDHRAGVGNRLLDSDVGEGCVGLECRGPSCQAGNCVRQEAEDVEVLRDQHRVIAPQAADGVPVPVARVGNAEPPSSLRRLGWRGGLGIVCTAALLLFCNSTGPGR